ncbi:hypothetical protein EV363DRAFT_695178 [Boletus edulis]|nr:hypothetical protein EV363DRAFT_695178 [Boletus edulis]
MSFHNQQAIIAPRSGMMLGKSVPEYIFIQVAIAVLRLIAPLSMLCVAWMLLVPVSTGPDPEWRLFYSCLRIYAPLEAAFFLCVYLPRRYRLQETAKHPRMSREERQALFTRCSACHGSANYPSGWFFHSRNLHRKNVLEWLLWALFSTSMNAHWEEWEDEIVGYLTTVENVLGQELPDGYNKDTPCMRLTLDPVPMLHRPLLWYLIIGIIDFVTCLRLYSLGFRHYSDKRMFQSFPPRPLTLFSRPSSIDGVSYWYLPHRSLTKSPILFLHGIGIGLFPYTSFLADLAAQHPDVGIIVPEFLSISSRITSPPLSRNATLDALRHILDAHSLARIVIAAHSYGTVITAQLFRCPDLATRVTATLLVDPIPFLLHLPDVAFNFVYRAPRTANEWLLWYFACRDPDVSRTISRHFFWTENILWKEDLQDKVVAVALCGQDQVVNAEEVRKYLTGEDEKKANWTGGRLEVLCYPELDHAMIFNVRRRWGRLVRVLDSSFLLDRMA